MNWNMPASFRSVLPIALAVIVSGCATSRDLPTASSASSDPIETLGSSAGLESGTGIGGRAGLYPLQVGNHWQYRWQFTFVVIPDQGDPSPPYHEERIFDRRLICVERREGRDYVVEELREVLPNQPYVSWLRFRQDRTGLYEADAWFGEAPLCAVEATTAQGSRVGGAADALARGVAQLSTAGSTSQQAGFQAAAERLRARLAMVDRAVRSMGSLPFPVPGSPQELTRLKYPLRPRARWTILNSTGTTFMAIVEGADVLSLVPGRLRGYRIRIHHDFLGPNDHVHVWYGPSGYLQLVSHVEDIVVDPFGQPQGRAMVDTREVLTQLELIGQELPIGLPPVAVQ